MNYQPSALVSKPPEHRIVKTNLEVKADQIAAHDRAQSTLFLAKSCIPGMRFPSFQVVAHSSAQHCQLHHKMPSDGRFRLIVFSGDISQPARQTLVNDLGTWLSTELLPKYPSITLSPGSDPHSGTIKFMPDRSPSIIDVLLIHTAERSKIEMLRDLHDVYHPFDSKLGWDYDKVFVDEESYHHGNGRAYEGYGVDPEEGALVIVRPDGYVGLVTSVRRKGWDEVAKWFRGVLRTI